MDSIAVELQYAKELNPTKPWLVVLYATGWRAKLHWFLSDRQSAIAKAKTVAKQEFAWRRRITTQCDAKPERVTDARIADRIHA
jgi:hypothetical protein